MDVAVLDPQRVDLLRTVFWDMTKITTAAETVEIPASGNASASYGGGADHHHHRQDAG